MLALLDSAMRAVHLPGIAHHGAVRSKDSEICWMICLETWSRILDVPVAVPSTEKSRQAFAMERCSESVMASELSTNSFDRTIAALICIRSFDVVEDKPSSNSLRLSSWEPILMSHSSVGIGAGGCEIGCLSMRKNNGNPTWSISTSPAGGSGSLSRCCGPSKP